MAKTKNILNIQVLYDFVIGMRRVDPWDLGEAAHTLYLCAKRHGINNTTARCSYNGTTIELVGNEIYPQIRAMAEFCTILEWRWNETSGRLDQHFGLDVPMQYILGDKIFKRSTSIVECISLKDVEDMWLGNVGEISYTRRNKNVADISNLYDFTVKGKLVDPWQLAEEASQLYFFVKRYGIQNIKGSYTNEMGVVVSVEGMQIPREVRAMAEFIITLEWRWNGNSSRLDQHFGLDAPMQYILGEKVFKKNAAVLSCITVEDVERMWLGVNSVIAVKRKPVNIQTLYDFVIRKQQVNSWELAQTAKEFYKRVKRYGITNFDVCYSNEYGQDVRDKAITISQQVRAMVEFINTLEWRWNENSSRLDQHFRLNVPMSCALGEKIFKRNTVIVECINVDDVINMWIS